MSPKHENLEAKSFRTRPRRIFGNVFEERLAQIRKRKRTTSKLVSYSHVSVPIMRDTSQSTSLKVIHDVSLGPNLSFPGSQNLYDLAFI